MENIKQLINNPKYNFLYKMDSHKYKKTFNKDKIILIQNYYKPENKERQKEINRCLSLNCNNKFLNEIQLLENNEELSQIHNKIKTFNINKRPNFTTFFNHIETLKDAYIIISNSDIYFNDTIKNIFLTPLKLHKSCFLCVRRDDNKLFKGSASLGDYSDGFDGWIYHTNQFKNFEFNSYLGVPFCDIKINYNMVMNDYNLINEPNLIKCFHLHKDDKRNYKNEHCKPPFIAITPKF